MEKYTAGLELEQFLIDSKGKISFSQQKILRQLKKKYHGNHYQKEVGMHMLEFGSKPSVSIPETFRSMLKEIKFAKEMVEENGLKLFPFASYPGEYDPEIHSHVWYELKMKILGEDKFKISGLCTGFHFHFSMPKKTFDTKSKFIVASKDLLENQKMVSSYNMLIAADPALTTLMQSSPYIQGKFLAKDSRMLFYRGGENLNYEGLYSRFQSFGGLQSYITTIHEIIERVEKRYLLWKSALLEHGFDVDLIRRYGRKLDYAWNPVKVNKHGTFEQRGMDANLPTYVIGASLMLQKMLQRIYDEKLTVEPCEEGIKNPFKLEGDKLFVPTADKILKEYQYLSAAEGLENKEIYNYCKELYKFIKPKTSQEESKMLYRIKKMLETRKTMSDELIDDVKKEGLWKKQQLSESEAAKFALKWTSLMDKDIQVMEKWL